MCNEPSRHVCDGECPLLMQVTDDSELAICLLHALKHTPASEGLPLDKIAGMYRQWLQSNPFDVGK